MIFIKIYIMKASLSSEDVARVTEAAQYYLACLDFVKAKDSCLANNGDDLHTPLFFILILLDSL